MLFVSTIKAQLGQHLEAIKLFKRPKIPEGVEILQFLGVFGDKDAILIFSAPDEATAAEFTVQFCHVAAIQTSLALPIEDLKWTH
ncbi:MAG: hypothetical protein JSW00_00025 [Thermoplasmata archaeon]|nr:MAG: hypothetical protein JSW00_00025 [Thermoplasmata archaeon]